MLSLEIGELGETGFDLSLTGFDEFELGELFAVRTQGRTDPDVCYRAISSFNDPGIVVHGVALNRSRCS